MHFFESLRRLFHIILFLTKIILYAPPAPFSKGAFRSDDSLCYGESLPCLKGAMVACGNRLSPTEPAGENETALAVVGFVKRRKLNLFMQLKYA